MPVSLLLKAIALGFTIAAPVGPIGLLCIQRTLMQGYTIGLLTGLGAATADAMYGTIGGLGLTAVTQLLVDSEPLLKLLGGAFLLFLGLKSLSRWKTTIPDVSLGQIELADAPETNPASSKVDGMKAYLSTILLTLSNPITILMFVSLFASVGLDDASNSALSTFLFVSGVFLGSSLWWLLLCTGVNIFRLKLSSRLIVGLDVLSGTAIAGFGGAALLAGVGAISQ